MGIRRVDTVQDPHSHIGNIIAIGVFQKPQIRRLGYDTGDFGSALELAGSRS